MSDYLERLQAERRQSYGIDSRPNEATLPRESLTKEADQLMNLAVFVLNSFPEFLDALREHDQEKQDLNPEGRLDIEKYGGFAFERKGKVWWFEHTQTHLKERHVRLWISDPQRMTLERIHLYTDTLWGVLGEVSFERTADITLDASSARYFQKPRSVFKQGDLPDDFLISQDLAVAFDAASNGTREIYSDKASAAKKIRGTLKNEA